MKIQDAIKVLAFIRKQKFERRLEELQKGVYPYLLQKKVGGSWHRSHMWLHELESYKLIQNQTTNRREHSFVITEKGEELLRLLKRAVSISDLGRDKLSDIHLPSR